MKIDWPERLYTDDVPHIAWTLIFIGPLVLWPNEWTAFWAGQWFIPREFWDQLNGWPPSIGKWFDVVGFEIAALILFFLAR